MADPKNLELLLLRPLEPIFTEKGEKNTVFNVPDHFLIEKYRQRKTVLSSRFSSLDNFDEKSPEIIVQNISMPNLDMVMQLGRKDSFSLFIPKHRVVAGRFIDILLALRTIDDFLSVAAYARDRVNPYLFNYAMSVAILHRPDTKNVPLPSFAEIFPEKFVDSKVMGDVREEVSTVQHATARQPIVIPKDYTASDLDEEHRLWYFREDIGINLHHWHWHLVYPFEANDRAIVDKDRRGELFYYMHQQIIARYNFERLCNQLSRVKRFNNFREPMEEGYFPKMDSVMASQSIPARAANTKLKDLNREVDQIKSDITDLERWRDRLYEAVHQGFALDSAGNRVILDTIKGIDILGNMMESSVLSPNRQLYGDLHNMGHVFICYCHDPDHRHLESASVMGDSATAMRDPIFYRWHANIDDIFQTYKNTLPPYTLEELNFPNVSVSAVKILLEGGTLGTSMQTFLEESDLDLARGINFAPRGSILARFTHLQHTPYEYDLQIQNTGSTRLIGMCRIFMAPRFDERGIAMGFREQRSLMIEMDKFLVSLKPGANNVRRKSADSSVTIPFERTFRNLDQNRPAADTDDEAQFNFCGCGWPNHMLIPKGTESGMQCQLFVMVTDYENDKIDQDLVGTCNDSSSFCGVRDRLYPDRRPMGYPFDRLPRVNAQSLALFLTRNMFVQDISITFNN